MSDPTDLFRSLPKALQRELIDQKWRLLDGWRQILAIAQSLHLMLDPIKAPAEAATAVLKARNEIAAIKEQLRTWDQRVADESEEADAIDAETAAHHLELLSIHRQHLQRYLEQQAVFGKFQAPPYVAISLTQTRKEIQRIKGLLRLWNVPFADQPYDESEEAL